MNTGFLRHAVATVLTVYGIETFYQAHLECQQICVATVLTVYGIETMPIWESSWRIFGSCNSAYRLRYWNDINRCRPPFYPRCNSAYRLRYWNLTNILSLFKTALGTCCNSAYRLRYWNLQRRWIMYKVFPVATVLTVYGIETKKSFCLHLLKYSPLQQCLPFTVLKPQFPQAIWHPYQLQQCLPFTVLKPS